MTAFQSANFILPPALKRGDKVAITCPAKKLPGSIQDAVNLLKSWGLEVVLGETVGASWHQFAGNDDLRAHDLQRFLDDPSIKAIFAARGGYGTIRIIDQVSFEGFKKHPKWLVGFSDITVLHSHLATLGFASIHGQMPLTIPDASKVSLETLRQSLFGEPLSYQFQAHELNRPGTARGVLTGGNLTLLVMMSGSVSEQDYSGKILFLEDVGEYLYSIDRMMMQLKRSGVLASIGGIIAGGFTDMKDSEIPFGKTAAEIILEHAGEYQYPVCFDFPAGHIDDNRSLIFGRSAELVADNNNVTLNYID